MEHVFELDENYIHIIEERFAEKKEMASKREKELFAVLDNTLTKEEEMAIKFLYAFMSPNDLGDYDGQFFLTHVKKMLSIRDRMPWGKKIPGQIYLHFVMPIRVNNENLELYCDEFFNALYDRVTNLTMEEAVLEINHWCHEKATYIGSDIRTISPLTLMKNGLGRCGEESSFTTAALRSLGIPARQCYTPRWAHSDSNHAWVEAWIDGRWRFLGACEPEPKLDMGWFREPTMRGMLVNTRVPGHYVHAEEVTYVDKWHTEINLLKDYTDTKKVTVKVVDEKGCPVKGAEVHYQVYNTAEFFPIARLITDDRGQCSLTTGYGDLFIHAFKDQYWGQGQLKRNNEDIEVVIGDQELQTKMLELDMVPPPAKKDSGIEVTEEERNINANRLKQEDDIRTNHEKTFIQREEAISIAQKLKMDEERVWQVLRKARGNSHVIAEFLEEYGIEYGIMALKLLESLKDKDLMDIDKDTLIDHLVYSMEMIGDYGEDIFVSYILCPRVYYEMLGDYKQYFQSCFTKKERNSFRDEPEKLVQWIQQNIHVLEGYTYYAGYASPKGSFGLGKTNVFSRNILFVALARSFGIPARLEPTDHRPQYLRNDLWIDAAIGETIKTKDLLPMGRIKLLKSANCTVKAEYYTNFSLARFEGNVFKTLDYEGTDFEFFETYFDLPEGYYRLITGTRLADGTVRVKLSSFVVKEGQDKEIVISFLEDDADIKDLGTIEDLEGLIPLTKNKNDKMDIHKNTVVAWIEPDKEPSKHLLREMKELAQDLNALNPNIYICVGEDKLTSSFDYNSYEELPQNTLFAVDTQYNCLNSLIQAVKETVDDSHPVIFVVDHSKTIRYVSSGYKLGIGHEVTKVLSRI